MVANGTQIGVKIANKMQTMLVVKQMIGNKKTIVIVPRNPLKK